MEEESLECLRPPRSSARTLPSAILQALALSLLRQPGGGRPLDYGSCPPRVTSHTVPASAPCDGGPGLGRVLTKSPPCHDPPNTWV